MARRNIAVGLNRGFITTPVTVNNRVTERRALRSRRISKRTALVR